MESTIDILLHIAGYSLAVMFILSPIAIIIFAHKSAKGYLKKQQDTSLFEKRISYLENRCKILEDERSEWEKIAADLNKSNKEMKQTWKSPWDQTVDSLNRNVNVNASSSIPINKIIKAIPEEMSKEDLEKCMNYYLEKYHKS